MARKRNEVAIIYEILVLTRGGSTLTRVARTCGLNLQRASKYLRLLLAADHLQKHLAGETVLYELTAKGQRFLGELSAVRRGFEELFNTPQAPTVRVRSADLPYYLRLDRKPARFPIETRRSDPSPLEAIQD